MIGWLFLATSVVGAAFTWNAVRPSYAPGRRALLSFVAGWLTAELALHHVALQLVATLVFTVLGALRTAPGIAGLVVSLVSWTVLVLDYLRGAAVRGVLERALVDGLGMNYASRIRRDLAARFPRTPNWRSILAPFPQRHPDVECIRDVRYARVRGLDLKLDVYRHRSRPRGGPILVEVHGGGWVVGSKNEQGIPLMLRLAAQGWICFAVDYRLSPHATFPDHLIDLKRALAWVREHAAEYGGDPSFIVAAGQSAGGHLASLLALTANDPAYQPGFEAADTAVAGCVSFYGVYDFTDRHGLWRHRDLARLLETKVMKASLDEDREAYEKASPMSHVSPDDPPFFVIHGDRDTLVPVEEARRFAKSLRETAKGPVVYAEIPGAQHAFEIFPSLRGELVLAGVERFAAYLWSLHQDRKEFSRPATSEAEPKRSNDGSVPLSVGDSVRKTG